MADFISAASSLPWRSVFKCLVILALNNADRRHGGTAGHSRVPESILSSGSCLFGVSQVLFV